ncbi:MAG: hypothetical protein AAF514_14870, partial [Verrucomicrobiota bacterium]
VIDQAPGFGDVVTGKVDCEGALAETEYENLFVLPRGNPIPGSSEHFLSNHTAEFLDKIDSYFDFVIFDTAPVLVADDTATLAPMADTTLFVIRVKGTSSRLAQRALNQLKQRQVNVGGVILNRDVPNTAEYRAYGYDRYYITEGDLSETPKLKRRGVTARIKEKLLSRNGGSENEEPPKEITARVTEHFMKSRALRARNRKRKGKSRTA